MKKSLLILSLVTILSACDNGLTEPQVKTGLEKNATDMYSVKNLRTTKTTVDIIRDDNVPQRCEQESKRRGFGGFRGAPMEACSFHNNSHCTIITGWKTNNDILGHELHHCFAGAFH